MATTSLVISEREDAGRTAVRPAHFERCHDHAAADRERSQAGQVLDDDLSGTEPQLMQLVIPAAPRIGGRTVEADAGDSAVNQGLRRDGIRIAPAPPVGIRTPV